MSDLDTFLTEDSDFSRDEIGNDFNDINFDLDVVDELADIKSLTYGLTALSDVPAAYHAYLERARASGA